LFQPPSALLPVSGIVFHISSLNPNGPISYSILFSEEGPLELKLPPKYPIALLTAVEAAQPSDVA